MTAIVTAQAGGSTDPGVLTEAYRTALLVTAGAAVAGLAVALSDLLGLRRPEPVGAES